MANDPLAFLDEAPQAAAQKSDPLSFLDNAPKRLPKSGQLATQYGLGAAETALFPYEAAVAPLASKKAMQVPYRENLMADIERLQEQKQAGLWSSQDQQLYDSLVDQLKNPEKAEQFIKPVDIGVGGLAEKGAEALGYDIKPEGFMEHAARIGGNFISPKGLAKGVEKGASLLTKEGRVASQWKSLSKGVKGNTEKEGLLNFAKSKDLSPEAATLLIQSKGEVNVLGKLAKKTKKFEGAVKELNEKLGKNYEELKRIGKEGGYLGQKETTGLTNDLTKMLEGLGETFVEGPDTKAARTAIEEALFKIENKGGTVKDLINSRLNLSQGINWNNIDPKGNMLKEGREIFMKAIEKKSPKIAEDLRQTDKGWRKYLSMEDILAKKEAKINFHGVPVPTSNIAFGAALKIIGGASLPLTAKVIAGKEILQRLSTELLTNPRLQGLHKKLISAILEGSTKKQKQILMIIKKVLKDEDPELASEIVFD
ncbi:MAG TPA: hypothetical protein VMR37_03670 [Rhabdochlamydiaceae bacterium]|nr:hypothetical protein [Rhabdochlamydiaceae bacterium]